jgi:hypothetical protein
MISPAGRGALNRKPCASVQPLRPQAITLLARLDAFGGGRDAEACVC